MALPYNLNFPEALDFMRDSQPLMLENYASIFAFIAVDHVPFNNGVNTPGQHLQMTFPTLTNTPPVPPASGLPTLFAQDSPFTGFTQLFIQNALGSINGFSDRFIPGLPHGQVNWLTLPSGVVFKWVLVPSIDSNLVPLTYTWGTNPLEKPFTTQFWSIVIPLQSADPNQNVMAYVTSLTANTVNYTMFSNANFQLRPSPYPACIIFSIGV
jgi:hypothetical protein